MNQQKHMEIITIFALNYQGKGFTAYGIVGMKPIYFHNNIMRKKPNEIFS
jgi:hypothetical protein